MKPPEAFCRIVSNSVECGNDLQAPKKELYEICQTHQLKPSSTDLIRIVCPQCGVEEVRPSVLEGEYEPRHHEELGASTKNAYSSEDWSLIRSFSFFRKMDFFPIPLDSFVSSGIMKCLDITVPACLSGSQFIRHARPRGTMG